MWFLACDLETTGLYAAGGDEIVEIALAIVGPDFKIAGEIFSTPVRPSSVGVQRIQENKKVLAMHTASGLLPHLASAPYIPEVAMKAAAWLAAYRPDAERPPLLGANPSFDRMFLAQHLPGLAGQLHYRNFDTNTFWLADAAIGIGPTSKEHVTAHRAASDIRDALRSVHAHYDRVSAAFGRPI